MPLLLGNNCKTAPLYGQTWHTNEKSRVLPVWRNVTTTRKRFKIRRKADSWLCCRNGSADRLSIATITGPCSHAHHLRQTLLNLPPVAGMIKQTFRAVGRALSPGLRSFSDTHPIEDRPQLTEQASLYVHVSRYLSIKHVCAELQPCNEIITIAF